MAKKAAARRAPRKAATKKAKRSRAKPSFMASVGVDRAANQAARNRYKKGRTAVKEGRTAGGLLEGRGGSAAASSREGRKRTTRILALARMGGGAEISKAREKNLMRQAKTGLRKSSG